MNLLMGFIFCFVIGIFVGMIIAVVIAFRCHTTKEGCEYWDDESNFCSLHRPSAQQDDVMIRYDE